MVSQRHRWHHLANKNARNFGDVRDGNGVFFAFGHFIGMSSFLHRLLDRTLLSHFKRIVDRLINTTIR